VFFIPLFSLHVLSAQIAGFYYILLDRWSSAQISVIAALLRGFPTKIHLRRYFGYGRIEAGCSHGWECNFWDKESWVDNAAELVVGAATKPGANTEDYYTCLTKCFVVSESPFRYLLTAPMSRRPPAHQVLFVERVARSSAHY
jgi:hypothetical protein